MECTACKKLHELFDDGQLDQVIAIMKQVKERAVERHCNQEFSIFLNDKGFPIYIHATDNFKIRKPDGYTPE